MDDDDQPNDVTNSFISLGALAIMVALLCVLVLVLIKFVVVFGSFLF